MPAPQSSRAATDTQGKLYRPAGAVEHAFVRVTSAFLPTHGRPFTERAAFAGSFVLQGCTIRFPPSVGKNAPVARTSACSTKSPQPQRFWTLVVHQPLAEP